jgi:hypothetical protein
MKKAHFAALALVVVFAQLLGAQDAKTVIANASKAMGIDGVNHLGVATLERRLTYTK